MSDHLLPTNASPEEIALARTTARISAVPVPIRELWSPYDCPVDLLPWLAWTLSVEAWDPGWPEFRKRAVIATAVQTARTKGTKAAVLDALSALGASAILTEWWEMDPVGDPHTFTIEIVGNTTTTEMQAMMLSEVNRTKPLRSHFAINWGIEFEGSINTVGVFRLGVIDRLDGFAITDIHPESYTDPSGDPYTDPSGETYTLYV